MTSRRQRRISTREIIVLRQDVGRLREPRLEMLRLPFVPQARAPHGSQSRDAIKLQEATDPPDRHAAPAIDDAVEHPEQSGLAFDEGAERRGHHAADLLAARMEVLGRVDKLIGRRARFFAQARESRRAQFDVGDADDVVIGHGDGEPLRRFRREGEIFRRAAIGRVERGKLLQPVDIVVAVSHVLKIDDAFQSGEGERPRAFRQVRAQARDEPVELGMAGILRQIVEALHGAGVRRLVFPLRARDQRRRRKRRGSRSRRARLCARSSS